MKKKKVLAKILAAALSVSMLVPSLSGLAKQPVYAKEVTEEQISHVQLRETEESVRTQINFNRNWKFIRSDVAGAGGADFDDSGWVDVAVPHNFSIPYEMTSSFYVGYGWYRKDFEVPANWGQKKVELEFEGVFQEAEIYINGEAVGTHRGGYSGFTFDITEYLICGSTNVIAVRVNNIWRRDLAPRAGDHQFTGGIYRDVYLNVTEDVHVAWYGTFVTTPDLTNPDFDSSAENIDFSSFPSEAEIRENIAQKRSNVRVQTEIVNASEQDRQVVAAHVVKDKDGMVVGSFQSEPEIIPAGQTIIIDALSPTLQGIELWSPENPVLYKVETTVWVGEEVTDTYESTFGFRWVQFKNDGFYLNGVKTLLNGANAHQDHAGFADAVTDEGFYRDVEMLKDCGMNFIRGSHYPHDPAYAKACDELGMMFWSECNFWGMGGQNGKDAEAVYGASDWLKDAYPQNPEDEAVFEQGLMDSLEAMIRVNRNHPSVINWSMGNEVFFTADATQQKAKDLVNKMRNRAHELDPTRKAGMGGVQRQSYDQLTVCDIAGYNGDGGRINNNWMPSVVAEYGSRTADRPGEYRPFYDQIQDGDDTESYKLLGGSAGLTLWCAFHHGTVGGDGLAKMGMVDYYRLPLKSWYWYRNKYRQIPLEESVSGTAATMEITASDMEITNDGKKDTQLIVTMKDENGNWVNDNRQVTLSIDEGPGIFPGGKTYTFLPNRSIRDGKASIEFRSYYVGNTRIKAEAEGLPDAFITIETVDTIGASNEIEPENFYDATSWNSSLEKITDPIQYGDNKATGRPLTASSNEQDRTNVTDKDPATSWTASEAGSGQFISVFLEWQINVYKIKLDFDQTPYPFKLEIGESDSESDIVWTTVANYTRDTIGSRPQEESLDGLKADYVRVTFTDVPDNSYAFLSEIEIYGNESAQAPQYTQDSVYLSDVVDFETVTNGWGRKGNGVSCEGKPLTLGGIVYEKGFGLHANSEVNYNLNRKYTRISGVAGIDDETKGGGDAQFQIYADDTLIYDKNLVGGQKDAFNLSVSGVQRLRLVTDQNGADSGDHTDWADVKLFGAIRNTSVSNTGLQVAYVGMPSKLQAGETFTAHLDFTNKDAQAKTVNAAIALYDADGNLVNYSMEKIKVAARKSLYESRISMNMPLNIAGHQAKINVWDAEGMEMVSRTVYVERNPNSGSPEEKEIVWSEKIDGEDAILTKEGTWSVWTGGTAPSQAYQGTETYIETAGKSVSYSFTGFTHVRVGAKVDGSQVGAEVYIDGNRIDEFSTNEGTDAYKVVWTSDKLNKDQEHTIKLVSKGKFGLDYFQVGLEEGIHDIEQANKPLLAAIANVMNWIESETADSYTLESRSTLSDALNTVYEAYSNGTEGTYDEAIQALNLAFDALERMTDQAAADAVEEKIAAIGTVVYTTECESRIEQARAAYDRLTSTQKNLVTNYNVLTAAEQTYQEKKEQAGQGTADQAAADAVEEKIAAIGTVVYTTECESRIEQARAAYDRLTPTQKNLVTNYNILTAAEQTYQEKKDQAEQGTADQAAADAVEEKIAAIGTVVYTTECESRIEQARAAYDRLTPTQKNLVTNYNILTAAEQTYQEKKAQAGQPAVDPAGQAAAAQAAADRAAADAVIKQIDAIETVTYSEESRDKISRARDAYDKLTSSQKNMVSNYSILTEAEKTYLDKKAEAESGTSDQDNELPRKGTKKIIGNLHYEVLLSSKEKKTVSVVELAEKNSTKITIPSTVKINGYKFKVTHIAPKAFYKNKKLQTVTLGANITNIGAKAFYGNQKLKSVIIKSKVLKKAGGGAFGNTPANLMIKAPSKKVTAYKKIFNKVGLKKGVKISKIER